MLWDDHDGEYAISELSANLFCLIGTLFTFHVGYITFNATIPNPVIAAVSQALPWAVGIGLLLIAVSPVDPRDYGHLIAFVVVFLLLGSNVIGLFAIKNAPFGTDQILFSRQAVDALMAGQNPYTTNMYPPQYEGDISVTPTVDGGNVTDVSYPAGSFLAYYPQAALGIGTRALHLTTVVLTLATASYIIAHTPREFALMPALIFPAGGLFRNAVSGVIDPIWWLPLVLSMHAIYSEDWLGGGLLFGLAMAMKQQPWFMAPFLLIWAYREYGTRTAATLVGSAATVFFAVNLPFIVWNPQAWIAGIMTPVRVEMVARGVGVNTIYLSGLVDVPRTVFTILTISAFGVALAAYWKYPQLKWLCWMAPTFILFFSWRALPLYFVYSIPIAFFAILAAKGILPERRFTSWRPA